MIRREARMAVYSASIIDLTIDGIRVCHKDINEKNHKDENFFILLMDATNTNYTILKETSGWGI